MAWNSYEIKEQIKIERIYSLFKRHYDKGHHFLGEMHNFWEVVYVIDGEVIISADENVHNFKSGDIIFHKPLELHKFNVVGENGATLLIFSFDMAGELCKKMERRAYHLDKYGRSIVKCFLNFLDLEREKYPQAESNITYSDFQHLRQNIYMLPETACPQPLQYGKIHFQFAPVLKYQAPRKGKAL